MRINEFLLERVLNLIQDERLQYADEVWAMLQRSYEKAGGFKSADDLPDLLQKTHLWKLVRRGDHISACALYKDSHGRKAIASGSDGSSQGKRDFMMLRNDDSRMHRAWAEVSGAPEHMMAKAGLKPLPARFAGPLTGKEILEVNADGYHYTRMISGEPHEKIIYGSVALTPDTVDKLTQAGIDLRALPENFN